MLRLMGTAELDSASAAVQTAKAPRPPPKGTYPSAPAVAVHRVRWAKEDSGALLLGFVCIQFVGRRFVSGRMARCPILAAVAPPARDQSGVEKHAKESSGDEQCWVFSNPVCCHDQAGWRTAARRDCYASRHRSGGALRQTSAAAQAAAG